MEGRGRSEEGTRKTVLKDNEGETIGTLKEEDRTEHIPEREQILRENESIGR